MIFTEPRFVLFFLAVFALHWALPSHRARKVLLLLASYAFYAAWDWRFLSLIWVSTATDWTAGRMLARDPAPISRRFWLVASLIVNLGLLAVFKYLGFFVESAAVLLETLGLPASMPVLEIVLPVGISFYTFQTLSYTIDVYRGLLAPSDDPVDFALFVAFFPQLVAGPIVRAVEFMPQLVERKRLADVPFRASLGLFLVGYFKKACVSDNLSPFADRVLSDPGAFDAASNWMSLAIFHVQLYCDFSGYSDMAIASAAMLGYTLPKNFDFPYFTTSVRDFWRRWHMTLSFWLRDYLYVPLGGNRGTAVRTTWNLVVVLVLCGLWHGAGWNFVLFGVIHAILLISVQWWVRIVPAESVVRRTVHLLGPLITTFVLMMSWTVFRAESFEKNGTQLSILFGGSAGAEALPAILWWALALCVALHFAAWRLGATPLRRLPDVLWAAVYGVAWAVALGLAAVEYKPFIYFQF